MKKLIYSAVFLLSSTAALAQVTPAQICQKISYNTTNAAKCAQVISRNSFDADGMNAISAIANNSSADAVNALSAIAGKSTELEAANICQKISYNTVNAVSCLATIANNTYSPVATKVASAIANNSSADAVNALRVSANGYMLPSAGKTCEKISYNTVNAVNCLAAIKNKDFMNGAEEVCFSVANNSSADAVKCLVNSAVEYYPGPAPRQDIIMSAQELRELKLTLNKTRNQIEKGMTAKALQTLSDAQRILETVEASNPR